MTYRKTGTEDKKGSDPMLKEAVSDQYQTRASFLADAIKNKEQS